MQEKQLLKDAIDKVRECAPKGMNADTYVVGVFMQILDGIISFGDTPEQVRADMERLAREGC